MLDLKYGQPDNRLLAANGSGINVIGTSEVVISHKDVTTKATVYVSDSSNANLLGRPQIEALGLIAFVNQVKGGPFDPVEAFPKLFTGLGIMPGKFGISLKPDVEPVRLFAPRPIAAGLREKAKAELDKMLALDVIEPVEVATEWCSGLTIAPKPNNGIRMCVDLTALNKGVRREIYPFPKVSDMLSKLADGCNVRVIDQPMISINQ